MIIIKSKKTGATSERVFEDHELQQALTHRKDMTVNGWEVKYKKTHHKSFEEYQTDLTERVRAVTGLLWASLRDFPEPRARRAPVSPT